MTANKIKKMRNEKGTIRSAGGTKNKKTVMEKWKRKRSREVKAENK